MFPARPLCFAALPLNFKKTEVDSMSRSEQKIVQYLNEATPPSARSCASCSRRSR